MNALEARSLRVSVRRHVVLDNCTMHVRRGAIYALLGDTGAGKTALLATVCGLVAPSAGDIVLFGAAPTPESRALVGSLVGAPAFIPSLSVFDNLMTKALAMGAAAPRRRCKEVLEWLGLTANHRPARSLSAGERARAALALALVGSPDLLLLDEPFAGLDAREVRELSILIAGLVENNGMSVVIASRGLAGIEGLASDYGVIASRHVVCELSAERLAEKCGEGLRVRTSDLSSSLVVLRDALPEASVSVEIDSRSGGSYLLVTGTEERSVSNVLFSAGAQVLELSRYERSAEDVIAEIAGGEGSRA